MMRNLINELTLVPLGIAIMVIGGGSVWLTNIQTQGKLNQLAIDKIEAKEDTFNRVVIEINSRLSRIEWKLEEKSSRK